MLKIRAKAKNRMVHSDTLQPTGEPTYFKTYSHMTMRHWWSPFECSKIRNREKE